MIVGCCLQHLEQHSAVAKKIKKYSLLPTAATTTDDDGSRNEDGSILKEIQQREQYYQDMRERRKSQTKVETENIIIIIIKVADQGGNRKQPTNQLSNNNIAAQKGQNGEGSPKQEAPKNPSPSVFRKRANTNPRQRVNQNHKTKQNLLIVRFSVIDVCSEMQKLPLPFWAKPQVKIFAEELC